jgi:hypothetical protein
MDGLEHMAHFVNFGCRNVTEDVPVKMHHMSAALIILSARKSAMIALAFLSSSGSSANECRESRSTSASLGPSSYNTPGAPLYDLKLFGKPGSDQTYAVFAATAAASFAPTRLFADLPPEQRASRPFGRADAQPV